MLANLFVHDWLQRTNENGLLLKCPHSYWNAELKFLLLRSRFEKLFDRCTTGWLQVLETNFPNEEDDDIDL